jgi:hypothetical protein
MLRYFDCLTFCYRVIVRLYPAELRTAYGEEMTATFQQVIRDEYDRAGFRGLARASALAFGEFFTVALPGHLVSDWLIAASLSLVITPGLLGALVGIMTANLPVVHGLIQACR